MMMIVLLLKGLNPLLANDFDDFPLRASEHKLDTANAIIPVSFIKQANIKLIERKYLISINKELDSINQMKDKYINEQNKVIVDFQKRINDVNKLNNQIKHDLDKQKRRNKIITCTSGGIILSLLIGVIAR